MVQIHPLGIGDDYVEFPGFCSKLRRDSPDVATGRLTAFAAPEELVDQSASLIFLWIFLLVSQQCLQRLR